MTDFELNQLGDGIDVVVKPPDEALAQMDAFVREMHTTSGLLKELPGGTTLADAEEQVFAYIQQWVPEPRKAPLGGNTVATDRGFLLRDMPALEAHLHYRIIDVCSIKELARRWYPRVYFSAPAEVRRPPGAGRHPRVDRRAALLPRGGLRASPGPDTSTSRSIASRHVVKHEPSPEHRSLESSP